MVEVGTGAKWLVELLTSWAILLQGSSDSFDSVWEPSHRIEVRLKEAALCFCCEGSGVLLGMEGAFHISIDCYDAAWSGHLELKISVVWHRVEARKCGSSKQCAIAAAKGDDVEDQLFASKIVRRSEDNLEGD